MLQVSSWILTSGLQSLCSISRPSSLASSQIVKACERTRRPKRYKLATWASDENGDEPSVGRGLGVVEGVEKGDQVELSVKLGW